MKNLGIPEVRMSLLPVAVGPGIRDVRADVRAVPGHEHLWSMQVIDRSVEDESRRRQVVRR
jgi:hypothetical protein